MAVTLLSHLDKQICPFFWVVEPRPPLRPRNSESSRHAQSSACYFRFRRVRWPRSFSVAVCRREVFPARIHGCSSVHESAGRMRVMIDCTLACQFYVHSLTLSVWCVCTRQWHDMRTSSSVWVLIRGRSVRGSAGGCNVRCIKAFGERVSIRFFFYDCCVRADTRARCMRGLLQLRCHCSLLLKLLLLRLRRLLILLILLRLSVVVDVVRPSLLQTFRINNRLCQSSVFDCLTCLAMSLA